MKIYIDESGAFCIPQRGKIRTSCVGTLVILESEEEHIFSKFKEIKKSWGDENSEYKGSRLCEAQVATVIEMLLETNSTFYTSFVDMSLETAEHLQNHKEAQANAFLANLESARFVTFKDDLRAISQEILKLSQPLYIQMAVLTSLIDQILRQSTLFYVQRFPESLGDFQWIIDAKGTEKTNYEILWQKIVTTFLQTESINHPQVSLVGADYSHYNKYKFQGSIEHLPKNINGEVGSDLKKILKETTFINSNDNLGLQIADILVTTARRTCDGHFQESGWKDLGKLTVQAPVDKGHVLNFLSLSGNEKGRARPYYNFAKRVDALSKQMLIRAT